MRSWHSYFHLISNSNSGIGYLIHGKTRKSRKGGKGDDRIRKMKSQILDEAKAVADSKIAEAKAQAEEIMSQARLKRKETGQHLQKSEAEIANYKERSSIDLQRRTKVLAAKQDVM